MHNVFHFEVELGQGGNLHCNASKCVQRYRSNGRRLWTRCHLPPPNPLIGIWNLDSTNCCNIVGDSVEQGSTSIWNLNSRNGRREMTYFYPIISLKSVFSSSSLTFHLWHLLKFITLSLSLIVFLHLCSSYLSKYLLLFLFSFLYFFFFLWQGYIFFCTLAVCPCLLGYLKYIPAEYR